MALLVPDAGESIALSYLVGKTASTQNLVLRLYTNNITPAEADTASTYTEASGFGYTALTLTGASWAIAAGAPTVASFPQQSFTFTGSLGSVYGYFMTRSSSGDLVYAERFSDGPYAISNPGDQIKVTATIQCD